MSYKAQLMELRGIVEIVLKRMGFYIIQKHSITNAINICGNQRIINSHWLRLSIDTSDNKADLGLFSSLGI